MSRASRDMRHATCVTRHASSDVLCFCRFSEKGKYYVDFKNGEGMVGEGDPANKPDVTISMNEEVFLKIFNRKFKLIVLQNACKLKQQES